MDKKEFIRIRKALGKTQTQVAQILGTSTKAVQSFEQGWRNIPPHVERQLLFLQSLRKPLGQEAPCWVVQACPEERRMNCPTWEFQATSFCWVVNGNICHGEVKGGWREKMEICRSCNVLQSALAGV